MNKYLENKQVAFSFLTNQNVRVIHKMLHLVKNTPSHFVFISPKKSGSRSIAKIVAYLKNLTYIELGTALNP